MKRTALVVGLAMAALAGCDLAELNQRQDGGAPAADAGGPPNMPTTDMSEAAAAADLGGADLSGSDDGQIPPGATLGSCDPRTWVASASLSHPVNPASYAIDGLQPTRWTTGAPQSAGQYLQIDFGGFVMIDRVALDHTLDMDGKDDYPRGLDVLVSYDGADYSRTLKSATYAADPGVVSLDFPAHAARYLRLQLSASAAVPWWTIHELTVGCQTPGAGNDGGTSAPPDMADPTGARDPNRAHWTATASDSAGNDVVGNAIDGVATTRWASGKTPQYGDEWFRLDLGQAVSISQVWLTAANGDHPSAWELALSTDDATYTAVARGLGDDLTKMVFPTRSARYVRIRQIGSGYDHWWSINELTVFQ